MALAQATLTTALAPTFKSPDFTSENDPEPGLAAQLPSRDDSVSVEQHQSLCADNWKSAVDTWLAEMNPPHIVATGGEAGNTLKTALLSAFQTWYANGVWDCEPLKDAFVTMGDKITADGKENHTSVPLPDWAWDGNTAPVGKPALCPLPSVSENSSTPFTDAADIIAAEIHKWLITGTSSYKKVTDPGKDTIRTFTWDGEEVV